MSAGTSEQCRTDGQLEVNGLQIKNTLTKAFLQAVAVRFTPFAQ
jgi:hypothetical protein